MPDFKGYISDLGGPSANMYQMKGKDMNICNKCKRYSCIHPSSCANLDTNHRPLLNLYKKAAALNGIKKIFIGSGVRYDLFTGKARNISQANAYDEYAEQLIKHHVSGRLKVAPEHSSDEVLKLMRKPSFNLYHEFRLKFDKINESSGLNQQLIPYFISSHPGCNLIDMALLAIETKKIGFKPEQVQDFTPTPMTLATEMYYTGINPYTGEKVFSARDANQKQEQHRFFFWYKKENHQWIESTLRKMNRTDLASKLLPQRRFRK